MSQTDQYQCTNPNIFLSTALYTYIYIHTYTHTFMCVRLSDLKPLKEGWLVA